MAFSNFNDRSILNAWGVTNVVVSSTATIQGDLLTVAGALADKDSAAAAYIALQSYLEGSTTHNLPVAGGIELERKGSEPTRGLSTAAVHGGAVGALLYLGDDGKATTSAGTYSQLVGFCTTTTRCVLQPTTLLYGDFQHISGDLEVSSTAAFEQDLDVHGDVNISDSYGGGNFTIAGASGNTTSSGTLAVTGAWTQTGALNVKGVLTIDDEDPWRFTPQTYTSSGAITGQGYAILDPSSTAALTMTLAAPAGRDWLIISDQSTATASHTVTVSGCNISTGPPNQSFTRATFNAHDETLVLYGVTSTMWAVITNIQTVALSTV